jgi:hypothetical protein
MPTNQKRNSDYTALYYLAGGFIIGCIVGRASSSVALPELPSRKDAQDTYDHALQAVKSLLARAG